MAGRAAWSVSSFSHQTVLFGNARLPEESWDRRQGKRRRNGRERETGGSDAGADETLLKSLCGGAGELRRIQRTTEVKDGSGSEGRSAQ